MTPVDGVAARKSLHGLLVNAHHDGAFGRVLVETADPRDLLAKVRVWRMEPVADTMWTPTAGSQNSSNGLRLTRSPVHSYSASATAW
jgi:hypothetical protein